ncbi:MAG: CoA transferase [Gammaproteobacteria bacterium]|nr:CoA transferase [Gammaproteobacteria bacterium]MDE2251606.1 CoA transferase [Gammaproteobacteria bacterium]
MNNQGALAGIRVLDLSRVLAGPWATQIMGDLGAEVIKIERPGSGDDTRAWGPPDFTAAGYSAYYASANRNKRSVTVDIASPAGQQLIAALARQSDVLVENYKVGGAARHGLDYATLSQHNPRLVYCSITGFGQTGPYAARAGYDAMIQGMGGLMSITGKPRAEPGSGPQKIGVAMVDLSTGLYAAIAVLAALVQRARTGRGQYIDLGLLDVAVAMLAYQGMNYLATGTAPDRPGNAHPSIVPYQDFPTADGWMMLAVGNDGQFAHFCSCIGHPDWSADVRFATNPRRVANRVLLVEMISAVTKTRGTREWLAALEAAGVPCGPINDIAGVFADPQVRARQLNVPISPGSEASGLPQPPPPVSGIASPLRLSAAPVEYRLPPPALGAHTRAVLREVLSMSDAQIDALAAQGAI